jgi:hypothetical protein
MPVKEASMRRTVFYSVLLTLSISLSVKAATITVTNTNDNGLGSLRSAVATANSSPQDDVIVFDISGCPNGVCTIVLTSGELLILSVTSSGKLTITDPAGPGKLIVSGGNKSRIFNTTANSDLTLIGLAIENGYAAGGGAIRNNGTLKISHSTIRHSTSVDTKPEYGGGGILSLSGNLTVTASEISSNTARYGGGVSVGDGPFVVRDSTIAENSAFLGGGISVWAWAKFSWDGVVANCTISGNFATVAAGALYLSNSTVPLRVTNSTITTNVAGDFGGAIFAEWLGGNMYSRNNIIAGNTAPSNPDIASDWLTFYDLGNNIISQPAQLAPLTNNGGSTRTHALLPASPAINAGNDCVLTGNGCGDNNPALTTDQRGLSRSGAVDIGAFEFQSVAAQHQLSGRITTSTLRGIPNSRILLDDGSGNIRTALTNHFGYFRLSNVPSGNYTVSIRSKSYNFASRIVSVNSSITDLDFVALEDQ